MSTLLALTVDSVGGAAQMRDRLLSLQKPQLLTIDAALMKTDATGKPPREQLNKLAGVGALGGALWGLLVGRLFFSPFSPFLGLAVGAGAGALAGSMSDVGVDEQFIKQVGESITPVDHAGNGGALPVGEPRGRRQSAGADQGSPDLPDEVVPTNLSQESEDKLRAAISAGTSASASTGASAEQ
jgi:uncharacterized membrane protein